MKYFKNLCLLLLELITITASAKQNYFVDGFHGGLYGHYPLKWYTGYLVDQLRKNPNWAIGLEIEPETWDSVKVISPADYLDFKSLVDYSGRIEYNNPSYAQSYLYCITGESIIRQFQYGIRKVKSHFPLVRIATYSSEEPCFTSALPQILKLLGFKYVVLKNPDTCWSGYFSAWGKDFVNWIGSDGTSILAVPRYTCETFTPNSIWQTIAWNNTKEYLASCDSAGIINPVGMCFQDAGWKHGPWLGPSPANNTSYTLWTDYFNKFGNKVAANTHTFTQEDVHPGLMWGSQVLQQIAGNVRSAENSIVDAEGVASMNFVFSHKQPDNVAFDQAWRSLLLSQHHDCWIVPYNHNANDSKHTWAEDVHLWTNNTKAISQSIVNKAFSIICSCPSQDSTDVCLFNTLGQGYSSVVEIPLPSSLTGKNIIAYDIDGKELLTEMEKNRVAVLVSLPPFGYTTISLKKIQGHNISNKFITFSKDSSNVVMENDSCQLTFDLLHGGVVTKLIDKKSGENWIKPCLQFSFGELRGYFADDHRFISSIEHSVKCKILENNVLVERIKISGVIADTPFDKIITLKHNSKIIDIKLNIEWSHNHHIGDLDRKPDSYLMKSYYDSRYMLSELYPVDFAKSSIYKNAPFDVCHSNLSNTFYNKWDSIKHNIILNWVDLSSDNHRSLALFSDRTISYSYGENYPLALTLAYSGPGLWGKNYPITTPTQVHYALYLHHGFWDTACVDEESQKWNHQPLMIYGKGGSSGRYSFLSLYEGYRLSDVQTQGDQLLVRVFNVSGNGSEHKIQMGFRVDKIEEVDLQNKKIKSLPFSNDKSGSSISLSIPHFGLKTLRIKLSR
mgnify:CR=1 FL=1|jgi:alpha-mannosidase